MPLLGDPLVCVSSTYLCWLGEYAFHAQPDGATCRCHESCQSNFCRNTNNALQDGACGKAELNANCVQHNDCHSGHCARSHWSGMPQAWDQLVCTTPTYLCCIVQGVEPLAPLAC